MALEIKGDALDSLLEEKEVLVVDFWAPWCGPCRTLGPIIESVQQNIKDDNIGVVKINIDEASELAIRYGIRSIPTVMFFKNGKAVDRTTGVKSRTEIEGIINRLK